MLFGWKFSSHETGKIDKGYSLFISKVKYITFLLQKHIDIKCYYATLTGL